MTRRPPPRGPPQRIRHQLLHQLVEGRHLLVRIGGDGPAELPVKLAVLRQIAYDHRLARSQAPHEPRACLADGGPAQAYHHIAAEERFLEALGRQVDDQIHHTLKREGGDLLTESADHRDILTATCD